MNRNLHNLAAELPPDPELDAWAQRCWNNAAGQAASEPVQTPAEPAPQHKPFHLESVAQSVKDAHAAVKDWLARIRHKSAQPYALSLLGPSGCGKTHLAKNAVAYLRQLKVPVSFRSWAQVIIDMHEGDAGFILYSLQQARVLIIDDLGAENLGGSYSHERTTNILQALLEGRQGKWTLLTSNFSLDQIAAKYDTRIASRLMRDSAVIREMVGAEDYAAKHYNENKP